GARRAPRSGPPRRAKAPAPGTRSARCAPRAPRARATAPRRGAGCRSMPTGAPRRARPRRRSFGRPAANPRRPSRAAERRELVGAVLVRERLDDLVELALEDPVELVQRQVDPVVRDASLREVVRADALGAVARADQAAPARGRLALALRDLGVAQA